MDFKVEIEYWEGPNGVSPIVRFLEDLPAEHQGWIVKREEFLEQLTLRELFRSPYFVTVRGVNYPLKELRYASSGGMNYRSLCFIWKRQVVVLEMFQGSGSNGRLRKHVGVAIDRAESWKNKHP